MLYEEGKIGDEPNYEEVPLGPKLNKAYRPINYTAKQQN